MKTTTVTTDQYWSELYDNGRDYTLASSKEITKFLQYTSGIAPKTALDIGCGTGQLTRELYHRGYRVVGIDTSTSAIKIAQTLTTLPQTSLCYIHLNTEEKDLVELPFSPYGLITCKYVYAFIQKKSEFLDEVVSVLDSQGTLVIISPLINNTPKEKKAIAVARKPTLTFLKKRFEVEYLELYGDGFFVCRNK